MEAIGSLTRSPYGSRSLYTVVANVQVNPSVQVQGGSSFAIAEDAFNVNVLALDLRHSSLKLHSAPPNVTAMAALERFVCLVNPP